NLVGHRVRKGAGNRRAPFWRFGQDVYGRLRREVAVTLIRGREKELILNDGPGEGSSELAVPELRLLFPGLIDERVVGVHTVIAPESKRRAMQFVCAGLGHHIDDRRGAVAVLRGHVQREFLELLHDVGVRRGYHTTTQPFIRGAVDQESVEIRPQPVHDRAVAVLKRYSSRIRGTWRERNQVENVAAVQGKIGDLRRADNLCQPGVL